MIAASKYISCNIENLTQKAEDEFFSGIRLANKTFKTTARVRMPDLDAIVARLASEQGWTNPAVLDVGVSSGVTTADLLATMLSKGLKPAVTATDLTMYATISSLGPGVRMLSDRTGNPLQFEFFGFGIRAWTRRLDFVTGYFLLTGLARNLATTLSKTRLADVALVSRLKVTSAENSIEFLEDDLATRNPDFDGQFDIVRAANLLNREYFEAAKLTTMIANLKAYVRKPGGLMVVNRTGADGTNHGTVFQASGSAMRVLQRVGSGSEIESLFGPDNGH